MRSAAALKQFMAEQCQQATDAGFRRACMKKIAECDVILQRGNARHQAEFLHTMQALSRVTLPVPTLDQLWALPVIQDKTGQA